ATAAMNARTRQEPLKPFIARSSASSGSPSRPQLRAPARSYPHQQHSNHFPSEQPTPHGWSRSRPAKNPATRQSLTIGEAPIDGDQRRRDALFEVRVHHQDVLPANGRHEEAISPSARPSRYQRRLVRDVGSRLVAEDGPTWSAHRFEQT